jgi:hypothetical protein
VEKEFESLLTKKMAKGGKMYYYKNAKELSEDDRFELKVLEAISGFNEGQTMNGILEILGYNQYRFGKYASGSELKKVKKALKSLINKGYCEESGLGYEITREGSDYLRTFEYGSY